MVETTIGSELSGKGSRQRDEWERQWSVESMDLPRWTDWRRECTEESVVLPSIRPKDCQADGELLSIARYCGRRWRRAQSIDQSKERVHTLPGTPSDIQLKLDEKLVIDKSLCHVLHREWIERIYTRLLLFRRRRRKKKRKTCQERERESNKNITSILSHHHSLFFVHTYPCSLSLSLSLAASSTSQNW